MSCYYTYDYKNNRGKCKPKKLIKNEFLDFVFIFFSRRFPGFTQIAAQKMVLICVCLRNLREHITTNNNFKQSLRHQI